MRKIKVNDAVTVVAGKDKGKSGTVSKLLKDDRVIVEGVNMVKKHQKPNPAANVPGGIIDKAMPIHVSNIALVNAATGKADRVGIKTLEDGRKVRYFKSNGEVLDS
ncbi:MAG TPA: 50S ribosomal protein L24 [Gammaproteobacteria bacterium]|nr:50S ribosomal protein L24 [Gammaproteobacteria bacterium]HCO61472.1 50S ribosomal protein L24 [Porticoccaceae bacterium]